MPKMEYEVSTRYKGVRRRKGQKTWNARYSVTLPNKQIVSGELTGFKKEKEAFEARTRKIAEIIDSGRGPVPRKRFSEVYKEYYDGCIDKAVSTLKKYDSLYRQHLEPEFGNRFLTSITTADIENFFLRIGGNVKEKKYNKDTCYSNEYLHGFRKLLNNIFAYALKKGYLIDRSPMSGVSKFIYRDMGRKKEDGQYISDELMAIILERLSTTALQPSVMIAYHTGMRISEVFGLLWSDVDFANKIIHVNKQLINFNGIWCFAKVKTPAAYRDISISDQLIAYLTALKIKQGQNKTKLGDMYRKNYVGKMITNRKYEKIDADLPFVNVKDNGELLTPASFKSASLAINQLGIGFNISFHDFRHTHITNLVKCGLPADILKKRVGHEKITTTLDFYKRITQEDKTVENAIINKMDLPDFETVKGQIQVRNHYLEDNEPEPDENDVITTEKLLGGKFNDKGFLRT